MDRRCGVSWRREGEPARSRVAPERAGSGRRRRALRLALIAFVALGAAAATETAQAAVTTAPVSVHRLSGNVYEYDYIVSTGKGAHDRIGVHRVVQVKHGRPISPPNGVFLVHGDIWNFNGAFVGERSPRESVAVYLAGRGIDVWGIDLAWTLVPAGTTDLSFMQGWGLQHDINDVETGMAFARALRAGSGSAADKLALMTWSRGGWIGYALLNEESQKPGIQRQVRAFIPVDTYVEVNDATSRASVCSSEHAAERDIKHRTYDYDDRSVARVGTLAQNDPLGRSPLFGRSYTNLQASLSYGATPGGGVTPFYHFVAGLFPDNNFAKIPTGLRYTTVSRWNAFLAAARPFESSTLLRDTDAITCSQRPTGAFDDHLADVTVPVLYVGAGGGFGRAGLYSLTLLGSKDITTHIVSFFSPHKAAFDFGHVDLFYARRAQQLVWRPIYHWLAQHSPHK